MHACDAAAACLPALLFAADHGRGLPLFSCLRLANEIESTRNQASFSYPGDSGASSIEQAGLGKQALLFVEQKPTPAPTPAEASTATDAVTGAAREAAGVESSARG